MRSLGNYLSGVAVSRQSKGLFRFKRTNFKPNDTLATIATLAALALLATLATLATLTTLATLAILATLATLVIAYKR